MAVKGINPASKCYVDVYTTNEVDEKFNNWSGLSSEVIPSNANLNDYQTLGFYHCKTNSVAQSISNKPSGLNAAFSMVVEVHAGIKQTITRYDTAVASTWVRNYYNGIWGAWTRINNTTEDAQIYSGTTTPSSSLGKNGDIYFLY